MGKIYRKISGEVWPAHATFSPVYHDLTPGSPIKDFYLSPPIKAL